MCISMGQFKIIVSPEVEKAFMGTIVIRIEQDEVCFQAMDKQLWYGHLQTHEPNSGQERAIGQLSNGRHLSLSV